MYAIWEMDNMNADAVYLNLKAKYDDKIIDDIPNIIKSIENNTRPYNLKEQLNKLQDINNQLYYIYGASDEIIIYQALINMLRHKYNIVDEQEIIHKFDDGEFVQ